MRAVSSEFLLGDNRSLCASIALLYTETGRGQRKVHSPQLIFGTSVPVFGGRNFGRGARDSLGAGPSSASHNGYERPHNKQRLRIPLNQCTHNTVYQLCDEQVTISVSKAQGGGRTSLLCIASISYFPTTERVMNYSCTRRGLRL